VKRPSIFLLALLALALASCASLPPPFGAPPNNSFANQEFFVNGCAAYTPPSIPLNGATCQDTGTGGTYYWVAGTGFVAGLDTFNRLAAQTAGGVAPTSGTGTVTSGSDDSVMEVTGATSPSTVTFGTAFTNKPFCVCSDETSGTTACKPVPNANGATVVVTAAGTDSYVMICVANAK
jgi:hypothetical protein